MEHKKEDDVKNDGALLDVSIYIFLGILVLFGLTLAGAFLINTFQ